MVKSAKLHASAYHNLSQSFFRRLTKIPPKNYEHEHTLTPGGCDADGNEIFNDLTRMFLTAHRELNLIFPRPFCGFSAKSVVLCPELQQKIIARRKF